MKATLNSYPKIYNLGHMALKQLFDNEVTIEEKVDGSQFSFGVYDGELRCRSKGKEIYLEAPEKMFSKAVEVIKELAPLLKPDHTYRGEYLQKPKHNALAYDRIPINHIILFDINDGYESYMSYEEKAAEAKRIGLEVVPLIHKGKVTNVDQLNQLLDRVSVLGGQKIEGFVIKNYEQFGPDKKALMGKFVSESFKEVHRKTWKQDNPAQGDIIQNLIGSYKTAARWNKAVQHLKEAGQLTSTPKDIGALIKEAQRDVKEECEAEIKEALFRWAWPKIARGIVGGLPEHYKKLLMESQFEDTEGAA